MPRIADIGVAASAAGCDAVAENPATGNQEHVAEGTKVKYDRTPPDSGKHYPTPAPFTKRFYTTADRPAVETLVHNLEHGYTVVWYRDAMPADQVDQLQSDLEDLHRRGLRPGRQVHRGTLDRCRRRGLSRRARTSCLTRWYADPSNPRPVAAEGRPAALRLGQR